MKKLLQFNAEFSEDKKQLVIRSNNFSYTLDVRGLDEANAPWQVRDLLHHVTGFNGHVELTFPNRVKARTF